MKTLLPWILVVALGAGLVALYLSDNAKDSELAKLRPEHEQLQKVSTELQETHTQAAAQEQQLSTLRQDHQELLHLRSEVQQLREDKQQLAKQTAAVQTARDAEQQQSEKLRELQTENHALRDSLQQSDQAVVARRNACINNLRQIDGAKQQWALENNKGPDAMPQPQDILPYFRNSVMPVCPDGGVYTINGLTNPPTCSIPGHALQ